MKEFPLIAKWMPHLERQVLRMNDGSTEWVIPCSSLEAELAKSIRVVCSKPDKANSHLWNAHETNGYDSHEALLIGKQQIKEETAEDLLREVLHLLTNTSDAKSWDHIETRARAYLTKKDRS